MCVAAPTKLKAGITHAQRSRMEHAPQDRQNPQQIGPSIFLSVINLVVVLLVLWVALTPGHLDTLKENLVFLLFLQFMSWFRQDAIPLELLWWILCLSIWKIDASFSTRDWHQTLPHTPFCQVVAIWFGFRCLLRQHSSHFLCPLCPCRVLCA